MIRVEVKGDFACFSRPEFKAERVSYDIITPSAARGILEAVFWHPGMKFLINKIFVLSEIAFTNIKRNELASKVSASNVQKVINGNKYSYLIRVNQSEDDFINEYRVVRSYFDGNDEYMDVVRGNELKIILPDLVPEARDLIEHPEKLRELLG